MIVMSGDYIGNKRRKTMASDKSFVDFIIDQIEDAGVITSRKMFGE